MASSFLTEIAVQRILRYMEDHLFEPDRKWPIDISEQRSYARWAAFEIVERLFSTPFEDPYIVIEEFRLEMLSYSCMFDGEKNMFAIAEYVATDILQVIGKEI